MANDMLTDYLATGKVNAAMASFVANLNLVHQSYPEVAKGILQELIDQRSHLKLIASENFSSLPVQAAMGNLLTDKYAEGYVNNRFYAGCDNVDDIEGLAVKEACALFGVDHAYVQPHSGADANLVAFWAILRKRVQGPILEKLEKTNLLHLTKAEWDEIRVEMGNQRLLGLDLYSGGHLTHGYRHNASAQMFDVYNYTVDKETGLLDYDHLRTLLHEVKPLIFLIGFSAYTRNIDYERMRQYADEVGAVMMVDMAHFAGLVAGGVLTGKYNPTQYADIITTTTHKTLRGPRGGMVLATAEFAELVDKGCPHVLGGPLPHVMAAKALAFKEASQPEFKTYAAKIVENSRAFAAALQDKGITVLTGGTDNHIVLVNVGVLGLTGRQAESALRECGITLNRNTIPFDPEGPWFTSGLRFGTPALTTLGMGTSEMTEIADIVATVLKQVKPSFIEAKGIYSKAKYELSEKVISEAQQRVQTLLENDVLYPEIDIEFLKAYM
ncbi:MAG: glycine hydroxymethyltransferase [Defluviitaleaceae bacterium]|nr:glycine hydroxymethyltransferase [Defluviitaleaceae bacterium]